jgi:AcrR family transcriptional regulator
MNGDAVRRRRRGAALEAAILSAAWAEITEHGYVGFAVEGVAARAGTSKAVLYRRWPGKQELAQAAIEHVLAEDPITIPDTGTLRGDVIALLRQANERRVGVAIHLIASLGEFYRETGTNLATLRGIVTAGQESIMSQIVSRAVERNEIDPANLTERITRLPVDLVRLEILMTSASIADDDIIEIVDTVFLPLVT